MLCGYSPFRGEDPKDIIAETAKGNIEFQARYWGKISQEGGLMDSLVYELGYELTCFHTVVSEGFHSGVTKSRPKRETYC